MGSLLNEQMSRVNRRIIYLKERRKILREQLPVLEADREWADKNASAQTWYHANVAVNQAKREIKRIEKEIMELDEDRVKLKMREEWKV